MRNITNLYLVSKIAGISRENLDKTKMESLKSSTFEHGIDYYYAYPGNEHYKLLSYISKLLNNNIIFDIGTYRCLSAIALSKNSSNRVISYDIKKALKFNPKRKNITYKIGDALNDSELLDASFILLDVDHNGIYEKRVIKHLKSKKWKGVLMLDDINYNPQMIQLWKHIKMKKYDATFKGHYTGTGIVIF